MGKRRVTASCPDDFVQVPMRLSPEDAQNLLAFGDEFIRAAALHGSPEWGHDGFAGALALIGYHFLQQWKRENPGGDVMELFAASGSFGPLH